MLLALLRKRRTCAERGAVPSATHSRPAVSKIKDVMVGLTKAPEVLASIVKLCVVEPLGMKAPAVAEKVPCRKPIPQPLDGMDALGWMAAKMVELNTCSAPSEPVAMVL